jgi:hypothetical protein
MVDAMSEWERHEEEVVLLLSLRKAFDGNVHGGVPSTAMKRQDIRTLERYLRETRGILFSIDFALSSFEKKHALVPYKRKRPSWMLSPPSDSEEHQMLVAVPELYYRYGYNSGWKYGTARFHTDIPSLLFRWHYGKKEWIPDPAKKCVFDPNGFHISGRFPDKKFPKLAWGAVPADPRWYYFRPYHIEEYRCLKSLKDQLLG